MATEGATERSLEIPLVSEKLDGSEHHVVVSNKTKTLVSSPATLHVVADTALPVATDISVTADAMSVTVAFSEEFAVSPAEDKGSYQLICDDTIISILAASLSDEGTEVTLTLGAPGLRGF